MSLHSALLLGFGFLIRPPAAAAQAPASDSTKQAPADSQAAHPDSASATDSSRASSDSAPRTGADRTSDTAKASLQPLDSILAGACGGPGSATVARDLLVIVFQPAAGAEERAAAARSVNGRLLGPVTGEPDAYYLRVPGGGGEFRLRAAADQLIQLSQVRQVGSRACPPLPPPAEARPKPS